jgi:hypothetical protein
LAIQAAVIANLSPRIGEIRHAHDGPAEDIGDHLGDGLDQIGIIVDDERPRHWCAPAAARTGNEIAKQSFWSRTHE